MNTQIENKIKASNQKYLSGLIGKVLPDRLEKQLEELDWSYLDLIHGGSQKRGTFAPLGAMELDEIAAKKEIFKEEGLKAIRACKVGAILLAGGQGTRLGFDKAKGMFIMTSEKNDAQTRAFFEEHAYFGYNKDFVKFFVQAMAPAVDFDGNFLIEAEDSLALSPNGNGGWFTSFLRSGLDADMKARGIAWLNVFAVDNVLQQIADPVFIGATILSGRVSGSKVVRKADPHERVGALCLEDGKPSIVEYYELTREMAEATDEKGSLLYGFGVILNYIFRVDKLLEIADRKLPIHVVEKKVPYINEAGEFVKPEEPNAYKFEELILDMVYMMDNCLPFEVEREKEFAPVKNASGVDSVDTARELLKKNGIEI